MSLLPKGAFVSQEKEVGGKWMALHQSRVENTAKKNFCLERVRLGLLPVKQTCFVHSQPAWMQILWGDWNCGEANCSKSRLSVGNFKHTMAFVFVLDIILQPGFFIALTEINLDKIKGLPWCQKKMDIVSPAHIWMVIHNPRYIQIRIHLLP